MPFFALGIASLWKFAVTLPRVGIRMPAGKPCRHFWNRSSCWSKTAAHGSIPFSRRALVHVSCDGRNSHTEVFFMSSPSIAPSRQISLPARAVPLSWVLLLALLVHGPLLLMQLPNDSYDADFHKFFAAHYAQHWFNPWNEKWFTGFSQTTYPPMEQQWMALFSHLIGLNLAYAVVQLIAILLLPIGVYRYARIWVS